MKKLMFLSLLALNACNSIKKLAPQYDQPKQESTALPDVYTLTGTTTVDNQVINPVRVLGSSIQVEVFDTFVTPNVWRTCNRFEYSTTDKEFGGGTVTFGQRKDVTFNNAGVVIWIYQYGRPLAPIGTQYRITSTLN